MQDEREINNKGLIGFGQTKGSEEGIRGWWGGGAERKAQSGRQTSEVLERNSCGIVRHIKKAAPKSSEWTRFKKTEVMYLAPSKWTWCTSDFMILNTALLHASPMFLWRSVELTTESRVWSLCVLWLRQQTHYGWASERDICQLVFVKYEGNLIFSMFNQLHHTKKKSLSV